MLCRRQFPVSVSSSTLQSFYVFTLGGLPDQTVFTCSQQLSSRCPSGMRLPAFLSRIGVQYSQLSSMFIEICQLALPHFQRRIKTQKNNMSSACPCIMMIAPTEVRNPAQPPTAPAQGDRDLSVRLRAALLYIPVVQRRAWYRYPGIIRGTRDHTVTRLAGQRMSSRLVRWVDRSLGR